MSDLISRKSVLDKLKDFSDMYTLKEEAKVVLEAFVKMVNEQPIACDIEKVISELVEMRNKDSQGCKDMGRKCLSYSDCGLCIMDRAIEIVKRGGVE